MADGRSTPQGTSSSRPRRGLGNGLGSLIPDAAPASPAEGARPLDVLFPESASAQSSRARGGSARELLQPRRSAKSGKSVSRETSADTKVSRRRGKAAASPLVEVDRQREMVSESANSGAITAQPSDSEVKASVRDGSVSRETLAGGENASVQAGKASAGSIEANGAEQSSGGAAQQGRVTSNVLDAIMGTGPGVSRETSDDEPELMAVPGASFAVLRVEEIIPNSRQPREVFDEDELAELAASITEVGVLQPIVVRPIKPTDEPTEALRALLEAKPEARYELIMGERRLRASELAGNSTVPAIIRDTEDDDLLRDALLENLHRVQLNPLEEASAYQQLMADFGATQEELSKRIARSRPQIANTLRLLKLPPAVQRKLAGGSISAGHARALLGLQEAADMERLAERIVAEGLSVRTTEELVRLGLPRRPVTPTQPRTKTISPLGERLVSTLSDAYDTRVTISEGRRKGKIVIEFAGTEDLERIAALLMKE